MVNGRRERRLDFAGVYGSSIPKVSSADSDLLDDGWAFSETGSPRGWFLGLFWVVSNEVKLDEDPLWVSPGGPAEDDSACG